MTESASVPASFAAYRLRDILRKHYWCTSENPEYCRTHKLRGNFYALNTETIATDLDALRHSLAVQANDILCASDGSKKTVLRLSAAAIKALKINDKHILRLSGHYGKLVDAWEQALRDESRKDAMSDYEERTLWTRMHQDASSVIRQNIMDIFQNQRRDPTVFRPFSSPDLPESVRTAIAEGRWLVKEQWGAHYAAHAGARVSECIREAGEIIQQAEEEVRSRVPGLAPRMPAAQAATLARLMR